MWAEAKIVGICFCAIQYDTHNQVSLPQELTGNIPSELLNGLKNVLVLSLQKNLLTGTIPSHYGQLDKLEQFSLNDNVSR